MHKSTLNKENPSNVQILFLALSCHMEFSFKPLKRGAKCKIIQQNLWKALGMHCSLVSTSILVFLAPHC